MGPKTERAFRGSILLPVEVCDQIGNLIIAEPADKWGHSAFSVDNYLSDRRVGGRGRAVQQKVRGENIVKLWRNLL